MLSLNFEAKEPGPENDETFTYVDSWSALNEMMEHLRKFKEIAFDLEHHSYRSFQGITCLIQVMKLLKFRYPQEKETLSLMQLHSEITYQSLTK